MPKPTTNESRKEYIKRCVPTVLNEGTTKDPKQAAAICYSMWKQHKKHSRAQEIVEDIKDQLDETNI